MLVHSVACRKMAAGVAGTLSNGVDPAVPLIPLCTSRYTLLGSDAALAQLPTSSPADMRRFFHQIEELLPQGCRAVWYEDLRSAVLRDSMCTLSYQLLTHPFRNDVCFQPLHALVKDEYNSSARRTETSIMCLEESGGTVSERPVSEQGVSAGMFIRTTRQSCMVWHVLNDKDTLSFEPPTHARCDFLVQCCSYERPSPFTFFGPIPSEEEQRDIIWEHRRMLGYAPHLRWIAQAPPAPTIDRNHAQLEYQFIALADQVDLTASPDLALQRAEEAQLEHARKLACDPPTTPQPPETVVSFPSTWRKQAYVRRELGQQQANASLARKLQLQARQEHQMAQHVANQAALAVQKLCRSLSVELRTEHAEVERERTETHQRLQEEQKLAQVKLRETTKALEAATEHAAALQAAGEETRRTLLIVAERESIARQRVETAEVSVNAKMNELLQALASRDDDHKKQFASMLEQFQCTICLDPVFECTALECSHTFCKRCIDNWFSEGNRSCPNCRTDQRIIRVSGAKHRLSGAATAASTASTNDELINDELIMVPMKAIDVAIDQIIADHGTTEDRANRASKISKKQETIRLRAEHVQHHRSSFVYVVDKPTSSSSSCVICSKSISRVALRLIRSNRANTSRHVFFHLRCYIDSARPRQLKQHLSTAANVTTAAAASGVVTADAVAVDPLPLRPLFCSVIDNLHDLPRTVQMELRRMMSD